MALPMDTCGDTLPPGTHGPGAAQEAPDIGQWEGQDVPLVRPSSCNVKGGIPSSRRYLPTYPTSSRTFSALGRSTSSPKSIANTSFGCTKGFCSVNAA